MQTLQYETIVRFMEKNAERNNESKRSEGERVFTTVVRTLTEPQPETDEDRLERVKIAGGLAAQTAAQIEMDNLLAKMLGIPGGSEQGRINLILLTAVALTLGLAVDLEKVALIPAPDGEEERGDQPTA